MNRLRCSPFHLVKWVILFLCGLSIHQHAFADGYYTPDVAYQKLPAIPTQRALLSWRDGRETLIISSTLDSESQRLGWIIPLPAMPDTMEKVSPGTLKTLAYAIQPRVVHDLYQEALYLTIAILWALGLLLSATLNPKIVAGYVALSLVGFVLSTMSATMGISDTGKAHQVNIEKTARVGAYDVQVLTAKTPGDLNGWLADNQLLGLPATAHSIVTDYISQKWVFLAVKLSRESKGENTPHPLKIAFASTKPVYPWKLTTLAGGAPQLELFVLGAKRAEVAKLKTEYCDRFSKAPFRIDIDGRQIAASYSSTITHPSLLPLFWDDCVLTKLSGNLPAASSPDDIEIAWKDFSPHQETVYTTTGARYTAYICSLLLTLAIAMIVYLRYSKRFREHGAGSRYSVVNIGRVLLFTTATGVIIYCCLPKLPNTQVTTNRRSTSASLHYLLNNIRAVTLQHPELRTQPPETMLKNILSNLTPEARMNPLQGGEIQLEDSPGNVTISKGPLTTQLKITAYDKSGPIRTETF